MTVDQDSATASGPEPKRPTYSDGAYGSEEQHSQPDGSENVGATYAPGTVRTSGNIVLGIVALVAVATLIGLYLLLVALR